MSDDGHKYFFGQQPEMPWKQKEQEMDKEFKIIVLKILMIIFTYLSGWGERRWEELRLLQDEVDEYIRKLG